MRWSTEKFAQDVLWACRVWRVSVKKAMDIININSCPIILIAQFRCDNTRICKREKKGNYDRFSQECEGCRYGIETSSSPYYDGMADMWEDENLLRSKKIRLLEQWFIKHGYLE